ncbi:PTS sugar transporter subunit IIA [Chelativorans sp. Marseille-P2723]|uniref:PTS sugar transporter subunit IIA n=1 Tax=Chelativorans sp. Marseille-P2723 TaxID=2709133 RepID=UPI00156FC86A|nr:PTS sugar transporter subunit IIA [Chelativorans sp. Marseille-P2723]
MNWREFISPARIAVGVAITSRREAAELLAELIANDLNIEAAPVLAALEAREKLGSTAIGKGVALPHARTPTVRKPVGALLTLKTPVPCSTPDGEPADIFIGFLVNSEGGDFSFLPPLLKHLREGQVLREIRQAETPAEAHARLVSPDLI